MPPPIRSMTIIRYYSNGRREDSEHVQTPIWAEVERAIRQMDNYRFPIVVLHTPDGEDDGGGFYIIGGAGRWSLYYGIGEWLYEDPTGPNEDVRLWDSDQGYYCKEKNLLTDVDKVLRITRAYYDSGSCKGLDAVT